MTTEAATIGLTHGASEDTGLGHRGPESKSIVVPYGFWLFVLSDMVLFSALFASYASLARATAGGPGTLQLFDRTTVAVETIALLLSSFVCGLAMVAAKRRNLWWTEAWLVVTAILGLIGAFAVFVWYAWRDEHEHLIPADEVRRLEQERRRVRSELLGQWKPVT